MISDEELEEQLVKRVYTREDEPEDDDSLEEIVKDDKAKVKKKRTKQQRFKRMASMNLNQNGYLFAELLLEAYDEELINDLDLSNELGVPHMVIPYVINKLSGGRR